MVLGGLVAAGVPLSTGGLLVRVNPSAPLMFGAAGLLLTGVALLAGDLAARRTIRVDPVAGAQERVRERCGLVQQTRYDVWFDVTLHEGATSSTFITKKT
ncbi:MAG: hypothetical protein VYE68_15180 [Acidobacteriota bacterium]|nr:hypothetical protein [Acidobacteriota bacterium]